MAVSRVANSDTFKVSTPSDREIHMTRLFDAPRQLVFDAMTKPEHVRRWWGCLSEGHSVTTCEIDLRVGGAYRIVMRSPEGVDQPVKGVFREIVEPERLVMTVDCSDQPAEWHDQLNPGRDKSRPPVFVMLQTVTFEDLAGKTRLTIRSRFDSAELLEAALNVGMTEGWSQSLDRLSEVLAKV